MVCTRTSRAAQPKAFSYPLDIARAMALGADWCNSARGFMFALGCLQAQTCHTGACPTGVATQSPLRQKALVVPDKMERVYRFHPPGHVEQIATKGQKGDQ